MSRLMSRWLKLLIGLFVALLIGWLGFGPLGKGAAYVDLLQQRADFVIRNTDGPPVRARMSRSPLSRTVFLCGVTNDLQRDGLRDLPGYDGRMLSIGGISGVVWDPAPPRPDAATPPCRPEGPGIAGAGIPLLVELLGLMLLAFLIGLGIGWLFFRPRRVRTSYLS